MIIEIKPKVQCKPPKQPKRKTRKYLNEVKTWGVNSAKWKYANEWCIDRGLEFKILTEDELVSRINNTMAESKYIQSVKQAKENVHVPQSGTKTRSRSLVLPSSLDLIRDGKKSTRPFFGRLNMFIYDPKFKKTLPYYDTFPPSSS